MTRIKDENRKRKYRPKSKNGCAACKGSYTTPVASRVEQLLTINPSTTRTMRRDETTMPEVHLARTTVSRIRK